MQKFSSIESFRHLVTNVRRAFVSVGKSLPVVEFLGTVKLHGTNAGVRVRKDSVQPQSRERLISITSDNAGFAHFVAGREKAFRHLSNFIEDYYTIPRDSGRFTFFGEWCGGNIQSKVGLNSLEKHYVIFNVYDHETESYLNRDWMADILHGDDDMEDYNDHCIHFIYEIPGYSIVIDFSQPEQYIEKLEQLTLEVEEKCPWAAYRGAEGIGEGIVWVNAADVNDTRYWFKTKGVKHQGKDQSKVKTLSADPVKVVKIRELVDVILPVWRLEQGVKYLEENGFELGQSATGQYLQWINKDIIKEESDTIAANDYPWKELNPYVNQKARDWYFKHLTERACQS